MQGRVPGVGLEEWEAFSQCLGGALSHHCSLAIFGNSEVSLLSLCFVIIIKYSRAQREKIIIPPSPSLSVALGLNSYFE